MYEPIRQAWLAKLGETISSENVVIGLQEADSASRYIARARQSELNAKSALPPGLAEEGSQNRDNQLVCG